MVEGEVMHIRGNTIYFKSDDEFYFKEEAGIKPNTVRTFTELDELKSMIDFEMDTENEVKYIQIQNSISPYLYFKRQIRDVSRMPGKWCWVISWFHEEDAIQTGFNATIKDGKARRVA